MVFVLIKMSFMIYQVINEYHTGIQDRNSCIIEILRRLLSKTSSNSFLILYLEWQARIIKHCSVYGYNPPSHNP